VIEVSLTEDIYSRATRRLDEMPIYGYSHRGAMANEVGVLGEIVACDYLTSLRVAFAEEFETSHDLRLANGKTVDIKTKDRTVAPLPHYECSVPLYNHSHQNVSYYIFVSLLRDKGEPEHKISRFTKAYILGAANAAMMEKLGRVWHAGETDSANGTTFWTDCINIRISELKAMGEAASSWNTKI